MKRYRHLFTVASLCLATLFLLSMDGCNTEEEPPVVFLQATPTDGSTILVTSELCYSCPTKIAIIRRVGPNYLGV